MKNKVLIEITPININIEEWEIWEFL
jgi:hypothetical protein